MVARSDLNARTYSKWISRLLLCLPPPADNKLLFDTQKLRREVVNVHQGGGGYYLATLDVGLRDSWWNGLKYCIGTCIFPEIIFFFIANAAGQKCKLEVE